MVRQLQQRVPSAEIMSKKRERKAADLDNDNNALERQETGVGPRKIPRLVAPSTSNTPTAAHEPPTTPKTAAVVHSDMEIADLQNNVKEPEFSTWLRPNEEGIVSLSHSLL